MTASDDTTRRGLLGGLVLVSGAAALPALPAAAATTGADPAAAWHAFVSAHRLLANQIGDLCVIAAEHGYYPADLICISLHNHENPAMAPALHFERENGDTDIIMTHGILVVYDRSRRGPRVF